MVNGATMEGTKVPIQSLVDICGSFCKQLEDDGMVRVVVGLLDCFRGEYMCH